MMDLDTDPRYGRAPPRRYYGKYAGTVSDNSAPSSGDHRGQVKVKVFGLLEETPDGSDNQPLEVLARPAFHPGFFFVPDNGTNVWVEFVAGDINYPIWTGVWYPDGATPKAIKTTDPTTAGDAPTLDQKIIRTTSGQVIQLDDTDQAQQTIVKDETNGNTVMLSSSGITVWATANKGNVTLQFGGGQQPTATVIVEDKKVTVSANQTQTIVLDDGKSQTTITDSTNSNTVTLDNNGITFADKNSNSIALGSSGITINAPNGLVLQCGNGNANVTLTSNTVQLQAASSGVTAMITTKSMDVS